MNSEISSIAKLRKELESIEKKSIILLHFNSKEYFDLTLEVLDFIINEEKAGVTYVTASRPYNYISSVLEHKNISKENLFFIDCITYMANILPEKDEKCVFIENPASLEEIGMHADTLLEKVDTENKVLVIDSLSTLSMYNEIDILKEFSHFLVNKLRLNGIGGLFIVVKEASTESIIETFAMMFDKIINIEEGKEEIKERESEQDQVGDARYYARQYLKEVKRTEREKKEKKDKDKIGKIEKEKIGKIEKEKEKLKREIIEEESELLGIDDIILAPIGKVVNKEKLKGERMEAEEKDENKGELERKKKLKAVIKRLIVPVRKKEDRKEEEKKEGLDEEEISGLNVEKTKVGNAVFINIKAIQNIENCIIKDPVPLKEVDIEVDGAEKIKEEDKTIIRWCVGNIKKGNEITLEYKIYKKTEGGIRHGIILAKEKLPPVDVTWEENSEVDKE